MNVFRNFVDGEFVETSDRYNNVNPVNGEIVGEVCAANEALVDRAVGAARAALDEWRSITLDERIDLLRAVADGIERRYSDFVAAEVADTGKSEHQVNSIDIPRGAANFRMFADIARAQAGSCFQSATPDRKGALNYTVSKPLGVVAVVSPWNLPLLLLTWKVAPALAAGNVVIAKPSEETPGTATMLAEVIKDAGIPKGVFNLLHGFGANSTGEWLVEHSGVDAITFTGESKTGSAIMRSVSRGVKPVSFELGGKNAAVVFADTEFEEAVDGTVRSTFTNCGQVCLCSERIFVQRPIFERFVDALRAKAEKIRIGRPEDGVDMGPLISIGHREKVLSYYQLARDEGATVITGGDVPSFGDDRDHGAFVQPTLWTGLADDARCVREEIFGPCAHIRPFDDEDEVIGLVNDSDYGLAAALWTTNLKRAHRVSPKLDVGIVWVNDWFLRDLRTPFGGVKLSGIGREGGEHSFGFYSEPMNICIKL